MRWLVPVVVLTAAVAGGCAAPAAGERDAASALDAAAPAVAAWAVDARLVFLQGYELGPEAVAMARRWLDDGVKRDVGEVAFLRAVAMAGPDGTPGDGVAPIWLATYASHTRSGGLRVLVGPEGVQHTGAPPDTLAWGALPALTFAIGSADAAAASRAGDPEFDWMAKDPEAPGTRIQLWAHAGRIYWLLGPAHLYGDAVATQVDAVTGAVEEHPTAWPGWASFRREFGQHQATVGVGLGASSSFTFQLESDQHGELALELRSVGRAPIGVQTDILGPDGVVVRLVTSPSSTSAWTLWDTAPAAGVYEVTTTSKTGLMQGYELHWCTDGVAEGTYGPSDACRHVG